LSGTIPEELGELQALRKWCWCVYIILYIMQIPLTNILLVCPHSLQCRNCILQRQWLDRFHASISLCQS
jgi:hypothetical protein